MLNNDELSSVSFNTFLVDQVLAQYRDHYYPEPLRNGKMNLNLLACDCLRLSIAACDVLKSMGVSACVFAGSARWMVNSGFEYEYRYSRSEHRKRLHEQAKAGKLPDIHCWAVTGSDYSLLVDPAAVFFPELMPVKYQETWQGARPTILRKFHRRMMVSDTVKLFRAIYQPDGQATALARELERTIKVKKTQATKEN